MIKLIKVQKKDGTVEDFDRNKILNGLLKSGSAPEEAENLTAQVESWVAGVAVNETVNSGDIRTKVLELLKTVNPTVASNFETYQKPAPAM